MRVSTFSTLGRRRRGLAGILAAILIFAMIFTAGIGYYVYENQAYILNSQAQVNKDAANLQASQEHLSLVVSVDAKSGDLSVQAYNVGGVAATITAVFVLSNATVTAKMLTPYLIGPGLNVTLPLSLAVGARVGIAISSSTFSYAEYAPKTVYANVLTLSGNVWTAQYPQPATAISVTKTEPTVSVSQTVTSTVTASTTSVIASWTTLTTTSGTVPGFVIGTNSLIVSMGACSGTNGTITVFGTTCVVAPAVYTGGEVILKASVTNYAPAAMNTYMVFQAVVTGGTTTSPPSVTPSSPANCAGGTTGTQSINTNATYTFTCTFSAITGSTAGTVTFIGYAVGSYTPIGLGGTKITITSAEASSNELQLGNPNSGVTGPWVLSYYSFNYASYEHPTFSPATIISATGNHEVVFQVKLTDTANVSLTVLQYSYLQFFRTQQEMDYYMISPVTTYTTSITAYGCVATSGTAPSGSSCTAQTSCTSLSSSCVPVGKTTTLSFAVCAPDTTSWMWANTGGGNSACSSSGNNSAFNAPEGVVGLVVVVYAMYNQHSGKWSTFSQTLPFTGSYISP